MSQGQEPPDQLLANPRNWRLHPREQQEALVGVLGEVGWVQQVVVNRRTGHLLDGHLRVLAALRHHEANIPVLYVDLSEEEETLVLATLDPLSAMAKADREKLEELLREIETQEAAVQQMLAQLAESAGIPSMPPDIEFKDYDEKIAAEVQYNECPNCGHRWPR